MSKTYGFDERSFRRVRETVRRVLGSPQAGSRQRRQTPVVGGGCSGRNEVLQLVMFGSPTGGTFDMSLNVLGTTETLTFNWDDTSTEVQTELETHTNIASGDVEVTGGPFPDGIINIEFIGDLEKTRIPYPSITQSLTGGSGMAVLPARWQPGYPKDGSVAP